VAYGQAAEIVNAFIVGLGRPGGSSIHVPRRYVRIGDRGAGWIGDLSGYSRAGFLRHPERGNRNKQRYG